MIASHRKVGRLQAGLKQFPEAKEQENHRHGKARAACPMGGEAEIAAETQARKEHVKDAVKRMREILRDLDAHFAAAGRSSFKSEDGWEAWLADNVLYGVPDSARAKRIKEIKSKPNYVGGDGRFDEGRWRDWLDGKLREDLAALAKEHQDFATRYVNLPSGARTTHERVAKDLETLKLLTQFRSRGIYDLNKVAFSPNDPEGPAASSSDLEKELAALEAAAGK